MRLVPFDVDGAEGAGGAEVLTGTATDAQRLVDSGDVSTEFVVGIEGYHLDGSRGAVAGTVAAFHLIIDGDAVFLHEDSMTDLDAGLLLLLDGTDGARRTYLGTARTFRTTVAALIGHLGLHQRE